MAIRKRRLLFGLGLLGAVGLAALLFLAKPAYRQLKLWRAQSLAKEALSLSEKEETYPKGWEKARAAYDLVPGDLVVVRALARVVGKTDQAQALPFWEAAVALSGEEGEAVKGLVESALATSRFDLVEKYLPPLEKGNPNDPDIILFQAKFLLSQNKTEAAVREARKLLDLDHIPEKAHFFYVQLTQLSPREEDRRAGVDYLWKLSERKDAVGLSALRNLARYPNKDPRSIRELMRRLAYHPDSGLDEDLLILKLKRDLGEATPEEILKEAETLLDPGEDETLLKLGRWLNQLRLQKQTLAVLDEKRAVKRKDLFLIRLDALAVLNRWEEIATLLNRPGLPLEASLLHLFKMRTFLATGQKRRADIEWEKALLEAFGNTTQLWSLVNYTSRLGLDDYAREGLDKLTSQPTSMRKAFENLIQINQKTGRTTDLEKVLKRMAKRYPEDPAVQNDVTYVGLLLDEAVEPAVRRAEKMVRKNPLFLSHHITLALAYLKAGRAEEALRLLSGLKVDWSQVRARWKVVLAVALRANGKGEEALRLTRNLNAAALLPEEKALLAGL